MRTLIVLISVTTIVKRIDECENTNGKQKDSHSNTDKDDDYEDETCDGDEMSIIIIVMMIFIVELVLLLSELELDQTDLYTISIARPPSTKDGRTMTGKPSFLDCAMAVCSSVHMPPGGCLMSSLVRISYHLSRSSASSMLLG